MAPRSSSSRERRRRTTADEQADYTTRIVVLTPTDRDAFNGTVIVEWLNVSGGIDAPAVWFMAHREIAREGYAYVAVSAQSVGVEGGASLVGADMSLKAQDPRTVFAPQPPWRRVRLRHLLPGRSTGEDGRHRANSTPKSFVAVGESQSAAYLTTYVNDVDPLAAVYDGFLVHSRFGPAAPLDGTSVFDGQASAAGRPFRARPSRPAMTVITETDLVGGWRTGIPRGATARQ